MREGKREKKNWERHCLYHINVLLLLCSKRGGEKSIEHERRPEDIHT